MPLRQDDIIVISPSVKTVVNTDYITFYTPKFEISLENKFNSLFLTSLLITGNVETEKLITELARQYSLDRDESYLLIKQLLQHGVIMRNSTYNEALDFHNKSSFEYLPKGIGKSFATIKDKGKVSVHLPDRDQLNVSLENLLSKRSSSRDYKKTPTSLKKLSTILWYMYGQNENGRNVASAGGIYPINIYVIALNVEGVENHQIYKYDPQQNGLHYVSQISHDIKMTMHTNHINYDNASFLLILTGYMNEVCSRYFIRGYRYLLVETGEILQNAAIVSGALDLSSVVVGAVDEALFSKQFQLNEDEIVIIGMVFGEEIS